MPPEQGLAVLSRAAQKHGHVIVAVSGGADSLLALKLVCDLFLKAQHTQVIAWYLHHYPSAIEPERKAALDTAARYAHQAMGPRFSFISDKGDIERIRRRLRTSWEHAASLTRRRRLQLLANRHANGEGEAAPVVTGHNLSDFEETVSLRRARGVPEHGLPRNAFINAANGFFCPLAHSSRGEVRALAAKENIRWFEDPANTDLSVARNRIRHDGRVNDERERQGEASLPDFIRVSTRELRISAAEFSQLQAIDQARLVFNAYRRLAISRRFTRNHFARAQRLPFALPPFFAHLETRQGHEYVVFRRGLAERLTQPINNEPHYIRGDKVTRSTLIETPFGHKSLAKIFSERRLSPRQRRQTLVYLRECSDKCAQSIELCGGAQA